MTKSWEYKIGIWMEYEWGYNGIIIGILSTTVSHMDWTKWRLLRCFDGKFIYQWYQVTFLIYINLQFQVWWLKRSCWMICFPLVPLSPCRVKGPYLDQKPVSTKYMKSVESPNSWRGRKPVTTRSLKNLLKLWLLTLKLATIPSGELT